MTDKKEHSNCKDGGSESVPLSPALSPSVVSWDRRRNSLTSLTLTRTFVRTEKAQISQNSTTLRTSKISGPRSSTFCRLAGRSWQKPKRRPKAPRSSWPECPCLIALRLALPWSSLLGRATSRRSWVGPLRLRLRTFTETQHLKRSKPSTAWLSKAPDEGRRFVSRPATGPHGTSSRALGG